jgi:hypothetical protein
VLEDRCLPSTLKVTNFSDDASVKGSLRYQIAHASSTGKDTILIGVAGTINLYSQLNIYTGLTIKGPGAGLLTLTTNYNFGDPWGQSERVFEVNASKPVVISGLTIDDNGINDVGAGIRNDSTLTLSNCTVTSSRAAYYGGGIANYGTLNLTGCTLSNDGAGRGGGVYNTGAMIVTGCTFSLDRQDIGAGSAIYSVGTMTVANSTFIWCDISGSYSDGGGNAFGSAQSQIGTFAASPTSVSAGGSFTFTVTNITDANPNSSISEVVLYGYSNDTFSTLYVMGYFTQSGPGVWTYTFSTAGWAPGTYTFFARAVDNYGVWGLLATSNTVQIV